MRVRIHKPRQHHLPFAVDLDHLLAILLQPGISQGLFRFSNRNNLPAETQDRRIFDNPEFAQFPAPAWPIVRGRRAQREQLADVYQQ
jgi:hypothetical protein